MERSSIYIGEVFAQGFISFQCVRKILFTLDTNSKKGIDLINEGVSYPLSHDKDHPINIGQIFSLDETLAKLGYPEVLTTEEINSLLNEDFYDAVVASGIYHELQSVIGENFFSTEFYKDNINFAKTDFILRGDEVKQKPKSLLKKMFKRGNK